MAEDKELKLIRGCIAWKRDAQNALYERYADRMFTVCYRYSRNREDAEDTFHEGFMKVYQNIKSFRRQGSLEGWIRRIMVRTAIEKFRRQAHLYAMSRLEDHHELPHDADHDLLDRISADELLTLIRQLPPVYKMVFNLYVIEGYKHREIAEQLGITEGTSKSNLSDARAILKRKIKAEAAAGVAMYHEG